MKKPYKDRVSHPKRQFRLDDEVIAWLKRIKSGTWNYTFTKLKEKNEKIKIKHK